MPFTSVSTLSDVRKSHIVALTNRMVVGYGRATGGRAGKTARQRQNAEGYCKRNYRRPLDAFFEDINGRSGLDMEGSGMRAMLDLARTGAIGVIVVDDIQRLSRRIETLREFVGICRKLDIQITTPWGGKIQLELIGQTSPHALAAEISA